jgi:hypothetical protein
VSGALVPSNSTCVPVASTWRPIIELAWIDWAFARRSWQLAGCDGCVMRATLRYGFQGDPGGIFCLVCRRRQLTATGIRGATVMTVAGGSRFPLPVECLWRVSTK